MISSMLFYQSNQNNCINVKAEIFSEYLVWSDDLALYIEITGQMHDLIPQEYIYEISIFIYNIGQDADNVYEVECFLGYSGSPYESFAWPAEEYYPEGTTLTTSITLTYLALIPMELHFAIEFMGDIPLWFDDFYESGDVYMGDVYHDYNRPLIEPQSTYVDMVQGTTGNIIVWEIYDTNPDYYQIIDGNGIQETSTFEGSIDVVYSVDNYPVGAHSIGIEVYDLVGNSEYNVVDLLVRDTTFPVISHLSGYQYEYGSTGNILVWDVYDINPDTYAITVDAIEVVSMEPWNPPNITYNVDGLDIGSHTVNIVVEDTSGNPTGDSFILFVEDTTPPSLSSPPDITFTFGTTDSNITWEFFDLKPYLFNISQDGNPIIVNIQWDSMSNYILDLDELEVGTHDFAIAISDTSGNIATDTVVVTVIPADSETFLGIGFPIIVLSNIILVFCLNKKKD